MRILAGVGAWLLGVGTATAGSLLAVSLLGQGIAASPGQQLTADAVNRALAREAHEVQGASEAGADTAPPRARTSPVTSPAATSPAASPAVPAPTAPTAQSATTAAPRSAASPSTASPAAGTVLMSLGGSVLAECRPAGAYLVSWSPVQGYEASDVIRGPVSTARVVFESSANSVTMAVSCPDGAGGAPVASSSVRPWAGGTDN